VVDFVDVALGVQGMVFLSTWNLMLMRAFTTLLIEGSSEILECTAVGIREGIGAQIAGLPDQVLQRAWVSSKLETTYYGRILGDCCCYR
jgi:hypothetical protein